MENHRRRGMRGGTERAGQELIGLEEHWEQGWDNEGNAAQV